MLRAEQAVQPDYRMPGIRGVPLLSFRQVLGPVASRDAMVAAVQPGCPASVSYSISRLDAPSPVQKTVALTTSSWSYIHQLVRRLPLSTDSPWSPGTIIHVSFFSDLSTSGANGSSWLRDWRSLGSFFCDLWPPLLLEPAALVKIPQVDRVVHSACGPVPFAPSYRTTVLWTWRTGAGTTS